MPVYRHIPNIHLYCVLRLSVYFSRGEVRRMWTPRAVFVWRWQGSFVSSAEFLERACSEGTVKSKALGRES